MKIPHSILSVVAVLALFSPTAGFAAKPDFSKLAGSYKGKYQTAVGTSDVSGKVDIDINVPTNGSKAVMEVVGFGKAPSAGLTVALLGRTSFKASRKVASDCVLTAFYVKLPARGRLKGTGQRLRYNLTSSSTVGDGDISYVLKVGRRSISIVGKGTFGGDPITVKIRGNRRK